MSYTNLEVLKADCLTCRRCGLWKTRNNVVFGTGPAQAQVLFVGEGPGENEDLQGEPFVGKAGQFLDDMLEIVGLGRHNCYIANSVKCRPPGNRDPAADEKQACSIWLETQIALLQPRILVCLGRVSAGELIHEDFRITREHGKWFEQDGIFKMAMYHPSALLRSPEKRPETFRDLKSLQLKVREVCDSSLYQNV